MRLVLCFTLPIACAVAVTIALLMPEALDERPLPGPAVPVQPRVELFHYWDAAFPRLRDSLADQGPAFNRHGAGRLVVTPVDHEAYKRNMRSMLANAVDAELFSWWAGRRTGALVEAGLLAPLDPWWTEAGMGEAFDAAVINEACVYDGRPYLLPLVQCHIGIFYNKAIFARAGLEPPRDWPAFIEACVALRALGVNPIALGANGRWPAQFWFDYLLLRTAGPAYRQRLLGGQASLLDPEVGRVFAIWRDLIAADAFNPNVESATWLDAAHLVQSHGAAMTLMGSWVMDAYGQMGWQGDVDYGYFPFPIIDADQPRVDLTVVDGVVLGRGVTFHAGLQAVLEHLASPAVQRQLALASGNVAPSRAVPITVYDPLRQQIIASVASQLDYAWDLAADPPVAEVGLDCFADFLGDPAGFDERLPSHQQRLAEACRATD